MQLNPYLTFNGQCEAAFKFYEKVLGGKIEAMMTYGGSPMADQTQPEWRNKIMHARMTVGDKMLMASDAPPDRYEAMKGIMVTLGIDEPGEAERIFHALSENGTVQMPIQETVDDQLRASNLVPAQPRRIERSCPTRIERRQIDRMRGTVGDQLGHRLAGRRSVENTPDAVAGGDISPLDTRYPADQRQPVASDRPVTRLPREDLCRGEHRCHRAAHPL